MQVTDASFDKTTHLPPLPAPPSRSVDEPSRMVFASASASGSMSSLPRPGRSWGPARPLRHRRTSWARALLEAGGQQAERMFFRFSFRLQGWQDSLRLMRLLIPEGECPCILAGDLALSGSVASAHQGIDHNGRHPWFLCNVRSSDTMPGRRKTESLIRIFCAEGFVLSRYNWVKSPHLTVSTNQQS